MKTELSVSTRSITEFVSIGADVQSAVSDFGVKSGFCHLYVPHTTAAVTINETADPSVAVDIVAVLNRIIPAEFPYRHGEGNSPAHIKASLIGPSEWIAVEDGRLVLGTWQGIFFCEFDGPRRRSLQVRVLAAL